MTTDELLEHVRQWSAERFGTAPPRHVVIELNDGDKIKLRVPDFPIRPRPGGGERPGRPQTGSA